MGYLFSCPSVFVITRSISFKFLDLPDKSNNTPRIDPAINVMNLAVTAASGETKKSIYWLAGLYARLMIYGNWFFICTKSFYCLTKRLLFTVLNRLELYLH